MLSFVRNWSGVLAFLCVVGAVAQIAGGDTGASAGTWFAIAGGFAVLAVASGLWRRRIRRRRANGESAGFFDFLDGDGDGGGCGGCGGGD